MNYKEIFKTFILSACTVMMAGCSSTADVPRERKVHVCLPQGQNPFALDSLDTDREGKYEKELNNLNGLSS